MSTAKQNAGGASGPTFGEVLSREVAGRGSLGTDSKGRPAERRNATAPGQPTTDRAATKSAVADKSGQSGEIDRDEGEDGEVAATAAAQWLALVANPAGADAVRAQPSAAIAAIAAAAETTAAAALPMNSGQEQIGDDATESSAVAAVAAAVTALPDRKPAASLPATAAAIEAAPDLKQQPELTAAGAPSALEGGPRPVSSTPTGSEQRAAPAQPVQTVLSGAAPTLAGQAAAIAPTGQAEAVETAAPLPAFRVAASAPETQVDQSVAGSPPLQQVASNNPLAPTAPAIEKITSQVGTSAWDQAVGQKVVWMAAGAYSSASLTLNPPDLGPLQVAVSMVNNQAAISFTAAQPEVRQALEAAMPKLREMLGDAGIQMGQASVNAGAPQRHGGHAEPRRAPRDTGLAAIDAPLSVPGRQAASGRQGLIDTFA